MVLHGSAYVRIKNQKKLVAGKTTGSTINA
jgi:hypothetical protein